MLPYENKVDKAFTDKVVEISKWLGINPSWLMVTMAIETVLTFRANILNPYTKAVGLIQFMPSTLKAWGLTTDQMKAKTRLEQLDYVKRYLSTYKGKMKSFTDVYLAVFYPVGIGKPDTYEFGLTPEMKSKIAQQNKAYDINKDGVITKAEVKAQISKYIPKGYDKEF